VGSGVTCRDEIDIAPKKPSSGLRILLGITPTNTSSIPRTLVSLYKQQFFWRAMEFGALMDGTASISVHSQHLDDSRTPISSTFKLKQLLGTSKDALVQ
jgi:hypothetical protein